MDRSVRVTIDRATWPGAPSYPSFPSSFVPPAQNWDVNIPALLLTIGFLTTPSHSSGVSLSEFWAWVRYLHAVSPDADLRLTKAFYELDSHQKTILSDDFGMGAPMHWLTGKLGLRDITDGRYFVKRVAAQVGVSTTGSGKKRGPSKSPDFVARDASGVWHVIECKGTQTNTAYREEQLGKYLPSPTGAIAQKRTIEFPSSYAGQRLATGLFLGVEGGAHTSSLHIIDPPGEDPFEVGEDDMIFAEDAAVRATSARSLRLAGFPAVSSAVSAPAGGDPGVRPSTGRRERVRQESVEVKRRRATAELDSRSDRTAMQSEGQRYLGRRVEISLPAPLWIGHRFAASVVLRYGVSRSFLNELRQHPIINDPFQEMVPASTNLQSAVKLDGDATGGSLHIGDTFMADLNFRK